MTTHSVNRWKAFAAHLGLSVLVGAVAVWTMLSVWYPDPFYTAMGGNDLVAVVVGAIVVLGPLLTLAVVNPGKAARLMRMDLAIIAGLQVAGLAGAVWAVSDTRPVYMVFTVDRFDLVAANEIREEELARVTDAEFRGLPWGAPRNIAVRSPSDPGEQVRIIQSALAGADLQTFPQYYVQYAALARSALKASRPLSMLRARSPGESARIDRALAELGRREDRTHFLPLKARSRDYCVLLDAWSGEIVGFLDLLPW